MQILRERTAAFSGHRTFKMSGGLLPFDAAANAEPLAERLEKAILKLVGEGYDTFLCGMAEGFDLEAAEAVVRVRKSAQNAPPLRLVAVIPYRGQAGRFPAGVRERYAAVLDEADAAITLSESYFAGCFHARNDYLVDHASALLCYYNGSEGGTRYTVLRALKAGLQIVNMA